MSLFEDLARDWENEALMKIKQEGRWDIPTIRVYYQCNSCKEFTVFPVKMTQREEYEAVKQGVINDRLVEIFSKGCTKCKGPLGYLGYIMMSELEAEGTSDLFMFIKVNELGDSQINLWEKTNGKLRKRSTEQFQTPFTSIIEPERLRLVK